MRLRHPAPFADRWRARWIWFTPPAISIETATRPVLADPTDTVGLFRRTIELEAPPDSAPCRIWVDGRYVLSVNGHEVARGPVRSDPRRARYDVVDLAEHLARGRERGGAPGPALRPCDVVVDPGAAQLLPRRRIGGVRGARGARVDHERRGRGV